MASPSPKASAANGGSPGITTAQLFVMRLFDLLIAAKWPVATVLCVYFAVPHLAGKKTETIVMFWVQELGKFDSVPWVLAAITVGWALLERSLRRRKTEHLSARVQKLEQVIDPSRTSSGLAPTGDSKKRRGS